MTTTMMSIQVVDFAGELYLYNQRNSSDLSNQPKSVDSIMDDSSVEAQILVSSLVLSAALSSATLASRLMGTSGSTIFSAEFAGFNIAISLNCLVQFLVVVESMGRKRPTLRVAVDTRTLSHQSLAWTRISLLCIMLVRYVDGFLWTERPTLRVAVDTRTLSRPSLAWTRISCCALCW
jgi:hypothetical protein